MEKKPSPARYGRSKLEPAVEAIVSLYCETVAVPLMVWGDISVNNEFVRVRSKWSFTDMDMEKKICFETTHQAEFRHENQRSLGPFRCVHPPSEVSESILSVTRSRGSRALRAIHKEVTRGERKVDFIEIWDHTRRLWSYDADVSEKHGRVIAKGNLASTEWSRNENSFLVVADTKIPKGESYFNKKPSAGSEHGTKFRWEENWGEEQEGVISPVIVVFELPKEPNMATELQSRVIEMNDVSLGQAIFTPDEKGLIFIGMVNTPYRLGSSACNNRLQHLYHYELVSKTCVEIGDKNKCIYSPRFTSNGQYLIYLQNEINGPHLTASELIKMSWPAKTKHTIVAVPDNPKVNEFPGLYTMGLVRHCTSADGNFVYVESQWHSTIQILQIDLNTTSITNITDLTTTSDKQSPPQLFTWQLFSVNGEFILASCSSVTERPNIVVGRRMPSNKVTWSFRKWGDDLRGSPTQNGLRHFQPSIIAGFRVELLELQPDNKPDQYFEAIYVQPKENEAQRMILNIHGGPHWASTSSYLPMREFLLCAGYALLLVNYRGSTGFGEANLRSLPGHVGDLDVKDVHKAVMQVKSRGSVSHVAVLASSHGGFIAAHLMGQYPSTYTACCLVNPVTDLAMFNPTDIPDWLWYEGGCKGPFRHDSLPTDEDLTRLRACSPTVNAAKIVTPCYFFLGGTDRRVDKGQGLKLYKHLLARGVNARCNMYNDNHQLGAIPHKADYCVNAVRWFNQYCPVDVKRPPKA